MSETKATNKQKKKILIILIVIILIIACCGGIALYMTQTDTKNENYFGVQKLYEELKSKESYSFITTLDNNNKMYYAKQQNKAYIETIYDGSESKFIIKDGNSYLMMDDSKTYYTYKNNEIDLNKIESSLEEIKDTEYEKGKEKIKNKTYTYEEYNTVTKFVMMNNSENEGQEIKTKFYFDGNKLEYIKTIVGNKQELLKVDISDDVDNNLFEIPSEYKEM